MENILNITNGDSTVEIMKQAGIAGVYLPWRDVLHDGPVPKGLSLEELSQVRAQFIANRGWGELEQVKRGFVERDDTLKYCKQYEKVILWFEHDLYDQLQILQILDWFHENNEKVQLSIICVDQYLGMLSPAEMQGLFQYEVPITKKHLLLASKAWSAFRSSPKKWHELLHTDTSALPFLEGAVIRMLEEYPSVFNGLSRTAQQALRVIAGGEKFPGKIFAHNQELEGRVYLGDASFWAILQELLDSKPPLLESSKKEKLSWPADKDNELTITPVGVEVLAGKRNWLDISHLDHWVGGVHLTQKHGWCWDSASAAIVKRTDS